MTHDFFQKANSCVYVLMKTSLFSRKIAVKKKNNNVVVTSPGIAINNKKSILGTSSDALSIAYIGRRDVFLVYF